MFHPFCFILAPPIDTVSGNIGVAHNFIRVEEFRSNLANDGCEQPVRSGFEGTSRSDSPRILRTPPRSDIGVRLGSVIENDEKLHISLSIVVVQDSIVGRRQTFRQLSRTRWRRSLHTTVPVSCLLGNITCHKNIDSFKALERGKVQSTLLLESSFAFYSFFCFACCSHVSLFFRSLPMDSEISSVFMKSLISSSHLFRGLPTDLFVLMQLSRSGSHSAVLLDHRSSGRGALLFAILHFFLLCSIKQGMFAFFIYSLLPLCFFICVQSNLHLQFPFCRFLRGYLPRKKHHCLGHILCLTLTLFYFVNF